MTGPIRVLIADDEPVARRGIQLLLAGDPDFQLLGECSDGVQTVEAIVRLRPDLVFLDIQMPRGDGFEVLSRLPPEAVPLVVFVTAFDGYTLRAFDVHAADYLLKPFSDQRFRAAATHAKERVRQRSASDVERLLAFVREVGALGSRSEAAGSTGGGPVRAGAPLGDREPGAGARTVHIDGRGAGRGASERRPVSAQPEWAGAAGADGAPVLIGCGRRSVVARDLYRPFASLTLAANWTAGGGAPSGFHLLNGLLHTATTVLLKA